MIFSKLVKILLAVLIAVPFPTLLTFVQNANAESAADPAPSITHQGTLKGKVLFDNTHGETAGAADWVIDGAFSDFGNGIAKEGYDVKELRQTTPITYDNLKDYDVFVLGESNIPFKASEQQAMLDYVNGGGSIFFIADHYNADRNVNRWDSGEAFNGFRRGAWANPAKGMSTEEANSIPMQGVVSSDWLGQNFGVRFRTNALGDITSGETVVSPDQSFGITQGVTTVEMHAGSTLAILDPAKAKGLIYMPKNPPKWGSAVDQAVYDNGGIEEGAFAAISKVGKGKAAFLGDSSPVEDATPKYLREDTGKKKTTYDGFSTEGQDAIFLINTIKWLASHEDYTSFTDVPGLQLSEVTTLHDFEIPENSTEPQKEPWTAPAAGYKWYDPSTFAAGSYGSVTGVEPNPQSQYSFLHQATLPNKQEFQIRINVSNLAPGQTVSNVDVGIYNPNGGKQLATFKNNGVWASGAAYSSKFNVTADATGHGYQDLTLKLDPSFSGTANLRLRVNGSNTGLESVTIADVPTEELPAYETQVPDQTTITNARQAAEDATVTVKGIVTTNPGIWGGAGFYLQDETGGVYVYQANNNAGYKPGDQIKISATKTTYNGEVELSGILKSSIEGQSELPAPKTTEMVDDSNQGQLLTIAGVTVKNISTPDQYGTFEFDAVKGATVTRVRIDNRSGFDYTAFSNKFKENDVLTITGIGSMFNGTYLLKPRMTDDVSSANQNENVQVQLLGINDLHGKIDQHFTLDINGDGVPDGTFGGAEFWASYIRQQQAAQPNSLLVGVGDIIGGSSPVSALFQDEPTVEIMNSLGMAVNVVGNHEFDEGTTELLRMVHGGDYPGDSENRPYAGMLNDKLAANVVYKDTKQPILPAYSVKEVAGQRIGFIGVVTQGAAGMIMPAGIQDIEFTDPVAAINNAVVELHKQNIHAIVVLAHSAAEQSGDVITGEAADYANKVDSDVDVIFAAHNHAVVNGTVNGKLIVQASEYGKAFSDVNLTIDPATGDIVEKNADIVWVDDSKVAPDPAVSSILAKYQDLIAPKLNEVEGIAAIDMKGGYASKGPVGDNALGDMLADGMRFVMNSDFALMNGGGIRDNLKQGPITWNELFNIQPFANTLVKLEIKGSDLRTILNAQISSFGPDYSISGFRYTWDGNTGKVVNIYLPDGKTKIDETKTYTITVNDFMATSTGSKYLPIGAAGKNPVQGPEDLAASVDYVKHFNGTPIFYTADGRISQVDGSTTPEGDGTVKVESGQVAEVENNGVLTVDVSGYDENQTTVALTAGQVAALIGKKAAIDVTNGDLVLHLPAENLQADLPLELMITKRTDLSSDSVLGTMYDFKLKQGENFISQFSTPVTLTFTVDAKAVSNPDNVKIYYYNEESKQWELIGGTYANGKISAATSHFSTYAVMEVTASDNQGGSNGDGQGGNGSGQDGNGSGQGTGSSGQGGNNNGQGTSSNGQGTQQQGQQSAGNSLPNTATNSYNLLLLGILLLAAGTGFYIRKRKTL